MKSKELVTAEIKDIWCQVLEVDELECDVDFYEIGGSSLKSLILFSELNQAFKTEFEIAELVHCRTVQRQAEAVWSRMTGGRGETGERSVMMQLAGNGKDDGTIVAIHDVSGDIYGYTSLAGELSGLANLYGIKLAANTFDAPEEMSVEDLAAEHVLALECAFEPSRELVILGWSLGGMVGFEVVKMLEQRGHSVQRLILLDAPYRLDAPCLQDTLGHDFSLEHERELLSRFSSWINSEEDIFGTQRSVEELWRTLRGYLDASVKECIGRELQTHYPLMAHAIPHLLSLDSLDFVRYLNRFRSVFRAGVRYHPSETTKSQIDYLSASESRNFDQRWSDHTASSFQERSLAGSHFSVLERKNIKNTAQAILNPNPEPMSCHPHE